MDLVNRRQPVDYREDLFPKKASDRIKKLVKSSKTCFFCINAKQNKPFEILPMSVQGIDKKGNIWFYGNIGSRKKNVLSDDTYVQLLFNGNGFSQFLSLFGKVTIPKTKNQIEDLEKQLKRKLLKEDLNDRSLRILKFTPLEGYYWDTKLKKVSALEKRKETIRRKSSVDSFEGKLRTG